MTIGVTVVPFLTVIGWVAWVTWEAIHAKLTPPRCGAQHASPRAGSGPYRTAAPGGEVPGGDGFREWAEYHNGPPVPDFDPAQYKAVRAELEVVAHSWGKRFNDTNITSHSEQREFCLKQYDQTVRELALLDERWRDYQVALTRKAQS